MLAATSSHLSYVQAIVIGIIQGVTELFPISSLGHSILLPQLFGWTNIVSQESQSESSYVVFLVGLHVGTAIALLAFYWKDWQRIIGGFLSSLQSRKIETSAQRLAWLLIIGTIPVGIAGLVLEKELRKVFATPIYAAVFLLCNGFVLGAGELLKRRSGGEAAERASAGEAPRTSSSSEMVQAQRRLAKLSFVDALVVGASQILALLAGFSRSGVSMVAGLLRGLDHEDAAKFTFLLATPVIFAAGLFELPKLFGHEGHGIGGQVLVGAIAAGIAAYLAVKFLASYFETKTLWPFAIYCVVFGGFCVAYFH